PEEIAASIIAELVQVQRRGLPADEHIPITPADEHIHSVESVAPAVMETAVDPVCNMLVEIATARHHTTYDGREFYFCCPACKRLFERNPQEYLVHNER
ncbi:MAG TPA: YHS domain-containing protein, partial [Ktedonobacteraceae bacterium]